MNDVLRKKIENKTARVGVIGMGYVGLPLAILAARKGFMVTGFLRTEEKVKHVKAGLISVDTIDRKEFLEVLANKTFTPALLTAGELEDIDIIIICVPTPITHAKKPDLTAMKSVAQVLRVKNFKDKLIINESTVAPGTTRELFAKLATFLACSPERVDPGSHDKKVSNITKVVGGRDRKSLELASGFYKQVLDAPVVEVSSLEAAEMAKMLENTYRAVNIALVNEIALLCEKIGVDVLEVIRAASSKWSFQAHYPGIGVGGHCIPVDPYYLLELAEHKKIPMTVASAALLRNNDMPKEILKKLLAVYKAGMSVAVYGLTYKKNVADVRESPVLLFCKLLKKHGIPFSVFDPHLTQVQIENLGLVPGSRRRVDIFVIGADHDEIRRDLASFVSDSTIIIDGKNALQNKVGATVIGVGRRLA